MYQLAVELEVNVLLLNLEQQFFLLSCVFSFKILDFSESRLVLEFQLLDDVSGCLQFFLNILVLLLRIEQQVILLSLLGSQLLGFLTLLL